MITLRCEQMTRLLPTKELWRAADEINEGIPQHWGKVRLGDVSKILNGYAFKSALFNEKKGLPIIRIRDIENKVTETLYDGPYDSRYIVNSGDILIGMDGDFRCAIWHGPEGLLNQRVCKIIPNENFLNSKLFVYAINRYLKAIQDATSFLTVTHLSSNTISNILFPLPPYNEQERIVLKIEDLFKESKTARNTLDMIPTIMKKFRQSVLTSAFSGKLTLQDHSDEHVKKLIERIMEKRKKKWNEELVAKGKNPTKFIQKEVAKIGKENLPKIPDSWLWVSADQVCNKITDGTHFPPPFIDSGIPFVFVSNIVQGKLSLDVKKFISKQEYEKLMKRYPVEHEDILYSIVGSFGVAVIVDTFQKFAFQRHIAHLKPNKELIDPKYLLHWLNSPFTLDYARSVARGIAQKTVNLGELVKFPIPLAPIGEQKLIVAKIEESFSFADQIENSVKEAKKRVDKIDQAILAKAFRGELAPQDPKDEPASVLLERIKSEREKSDQKISKISRKKMIKKLT